MTDELGDAINLLREHYRFRVDYERDAMRDTTTVTGTVRVAMCRLASRVDHVDLSETEALEELMAHRALVSLLRLRMALSQPGVEAMLDYYETLDPREHGWGMT